VLKRYHAERAGASFDILPAIDLLAGQVVRLRGGDFNQATIFSADPVETGVRLRDAGARWLHVVDLDGARAGEPRHSKVVMQIVAAVGDEVSVEAAGGLRSEAAVEAALANGTSRVVLGTAALEAPDLVRRLLELHGPDAIAIAIDVRDGLAVGEAWRENQAGKSAMDLVVGLASVGARWFEVTAIDRDGLLGGPDIVLLRRMVALRAGRIIASGGISSIDDLKMVRETGCSGAIVGRAIYEGGIRLEDALAALAD
jgi:phosphoribosylformimino-5-aminoimidazole carboxamide ribotide isomerase